MLKTQIIVASTRQGRNADVILEWLKTSVKDHPSLACEVVDLRDWPLPIFQETMASIGDPKNPTYSAPIVKQWNAKIAEADCYVFLTPEYNHSIPGGLKNAIDSVFVSFAFRHKAAAFVSYSNGLGAGVRAVEHLIQVMAETETSVVRTPVLIPNVMTAFEGGKPVNKMIEATLKVTLEDLAWQGNAMKNARAGGQLPPPTFRVRAAMSAMAPK